MATSSIGKLSRSGLSQKARRQIRNALYNQPPIEITTATFTLNPRDHAGRTLVLNKADGIAITLPSATGSGDRYRFVVGTTFSGGSGAISTRSPDLMVGNALLGQDSTTGCLHFPTGSDTSVFTMTGSTTGGRAGAVAEFEDIADNKWLVQYVSEASGSENTPFSAAF